MPVELQDALARDDSARARFAALLADHRRIVFKVAATYCANAEDRRDLAQEISAQLWRAFPGYDPERPFSTWMYRIALNVAISFARKAGPRARREESLADQGVDELLANEREPPDERLAALLRAVAKLGDLDRALLLLFLEDRSYREIAEVLGISETNVATKLGRLKQRIRDDLTRR